MFLKIMSGEDAPDGDSRKTYRLFSHVSSVNFDRRAKGTAVAEVVFDVDSASGVGITLELEGNTYLMNEDGKTIATFGCMPIP